MLSFEKIHKKVIKCTPHTSNSRYNILRLLSKETTEDCGGFAKKNAYFVKKILFRAAS